MESLKDKVAIVGVGYTPQEFKIKGRDAHSFHVEAARNAIEDAGLKVEEVDGLLAQAQPLSNVHMHSPIEIAQQLGMRLRFGATQYNAGASAGCMLFHAAAALLYGQANYVVCTYGTSSDERAQVARGTRNEAAAFGWFGPGAGYAMAAQRGMHEFKTGPETWSEIAVAQRQWANLNPRAVMQGRKLSFEDYFNSKIYVQPFRQLDMCLVTDSGRAFVMTTAERARDLKQRPVYVMGVGQDHPGTFIIQADFMAGATGARVAGAEAFEMAGVTLKDIDACEIYDCFTYTVELTLMDYGFFGPGEGKDFFANGRTAPGGEMPVNTSGGLLSEVYQMGFTPMTEAVTQLQGRAGERQLGPATGTKEPEIMLVSGNGGVAFQHHATVILRK